MQNQLYVTKASGEQSLFSEEKIRKSLQRSGADEDQVDFIIAEVKKQLYDGMTTRKIYRIAFSLLKSGASHLAARYHLKQAIMELGPTGFPLEKYIAELLRFEGYKARMRQILQGKCVAHEIDVIAEKETDFLFIECKYHNQQGIFSNVKIPLYIHARFLDIQNQDLKHAAYVSKKHTAMIVTNTRFTADAVQYAGCSGIRLLAWDQPFNKGLKEKIDNSGLYPITCLTSLTAAEKQRLLDREMVLCTEIRDNENLLAKIGIKTSRIARVMNEVQRLCGHAATSKH